MGAYAKKHGLSASTLYHWQQKMRLRQATAIDADAPANFDAVPHDIEPGATVPAGKFMVLRIASGEPYQSAQSIVLAPVCCAPPASCAPVVAPLDAIVPTDAAPNNWTLILPGCIRLELPMLPEPRWLAALSHYAQGAH